MRWGLIALILGLGVPAVAQQGQEEHGLVDVQAIDPTIQVELKYATTDNVLGEPLYPWNARCFVRHEVAEALARVQARLREQGYGLKIWDGYRPLAAQKQLWQKFPVPGFVANPATGSNHNRGMAVDLTLVDQRGRQVDMPTPYDEFSERAARNYHGGTVRSRQHRQILQEAMLAEGFAGLMNEWWHFDYQHAKSYPVLDVPIERLLQAEDTEPTQAGRRVR